MPGLTRRQFGASLLAGLAGSLAGQPASAARKPRQARILWIAGDGLGTAPRRHLGALADQPIPIHGNAIWFNRPSDLGWMQGYHDDPSGVQEIYGAGHALHLICFLDPTDPACQSPYATMSGPGGFLDDHLPWLVDTFKGGGTQPFYVTVFTELETYGTYTQAGLVAAFHTAVDRIKTRAPWARVGLGLGGYAWPNTPGGTRDLSVYEPAFTVSDVLMTQMMQDGANVTSEMIPRFRNGIAQLGTYGKPVMISHFKLWGTLSDQLNAWKVFQANCMTDDQLKLFTSQGLSVWNLMDDAYCHTPYVQSQVWHDFEVDTGQWHASVGSVALAPDAAYAGTQSLKHTYTWPTGPVTVVFDNWPRAPLDLSAYGAWMGLRVRTTPRLKGLQGRLSVIRADNTREYGQRWYVPVGDIFNARDFFNVIGKFTAGSMASFKELSLELYHPSGPGTTESVWIDQWTQGHDVPAWQSGLSILQRWAA